MTKLNKEQREALLEVLDNKFPQITSLQYVINKKKNDTLFDQNCIVYKGSDHIIEEMEGLNFKVGAKTFFQTNSTQALELYRLTRNFAELNGHELVYDLYTGTGSIACFVASKAKHVIGIDYIPESIENAKENAIANKIENCSFFAGDMGKTLTSEFIQEHGRADVVITDPPRSGMNPDVVARLIEMRPEKIVYVSCNPATQARDLALLAEHYTIEKVQPVDMFPHTHHVENIVLLRVKS
jgi:23S rRNA (uracil1939-C5)-methyltransferase